MAKRIFMFLMVVLLLGFSAVAVIVGLRLNQQPDDSGVAGPYGFSECGNGVCEVGEIATCPEDCEGAVCGNGECETGEGSDTCPADCPVPIVCGNGVCEAGEDSDNCLVDCPRIVPPICGNGTCDENENEGTCPEDCTASAVCGNGTVETGEECDDGNTTSGDGCDSNCQIETTNTCGDGTCQEGEEQTCPDDCTVVEETQCSDNLDNDGDGAVDCDDPGCYPDGDMTGVCDQTDDNEAGYDPMQPDLIATTLVLRSQANGGGTVLSQSELSAGQMVYPHCYFDVAAPTSVYTFTVRISINAQTFVSEEVSLSPGANYYVQGPYVVEDTVQLNLSCLVDTSDAIEESDESNNLVAASFVIGSTASQCEDGIDNDGDTLIDIDDPACHTDGNADNAASYDPSRSESILPRTGLLDDYILIWLGMASLLLALFAYRRGWGRDSLEGLVWNLYSHLPLGYERMIEAKTDRKRKLDKR